MPTFVIVLFSLRDIIFVSSAEALVASFDYLAFPEDRSSLDETIVSAPSIVFIEREIVVVVKLEKGFFPFLSAIVLGVISLRFSSRFTIRHSPFLVSLCILSPLNSKKTNVPIG